MFRHPISDVHEWINKIPSVSIYFLMKLLTKGIGLEKLTRKEDPCSDIIRRYKNSSISEI